MGWGSGSFGNFVADEVSIITDSAGKLKSTDSIATPISQFYIAITNHDSANVTFLNGIDNSVAATVSLGNSYLYPNGVACSNDGVYTYVGNHYALSATGYISVIDNNKQNVITTWQPSGSRSFTQLEISRDDSILFAVDNSLGVVYAISTKTGDVISSKVAGLSDAIAIAVSHNNKFLYILEGTSGTAYQIRISDLTQTNSYAITSSVQGNLCISPDDRYVWVCTQATEGEIQMIDTVTGDVTSYSLAGASTASIYSGTLSLDGRYLYLCSNGGSSNYSGLVIFDTLNTSSDVTTISLSAPTWIATTRNGLYVYAVESKTNEIAVISTATKTLVSTISMPSGTSSANYIAMQNYQTIASISQISRQSYNNNNSYQDLTAQTTTSTSAVSLGSIGITPLHTGIIRVYLTVRSSNDTLGDGVTISLYSGATSGTLTNSLDSETYTQEGLASNEHTSQLYYELTPSDVNSLAGQYLGKPVYLTAAFNAVTGGTASAKVVRLYAEEV